MSEWLDDIELYLGAAAAEITELRRKMHTLLARLRWDLRESECGHGVLFTQPCEECGAGPVDEFVVLASVPLESRVSDWIKTRLGMEHANRKERTLRGLEEAIEWAQSEGISQDTVYQLLEHVYWRKKGDPQQEAGGVAVCLLGWCAATGTTLREVALAEIERIEAKPLSEVAASLERKMDARLVVFDDDGRVPE